MVQVYYQKLSEPFTAAPRLPWQGLLGLEEGDEG